MIIRIRLLFALSFFTIYVFGGSIPVTPIPLENVHSISSIRDFVSYWDILLYILCLLLVVPFVYIGYLKKNRIPHKHIPYHFKGEYTAKYIIEYLEGLEILFGKKFHKFKKSIKQYNKDSAGDLRKHAEVINSIMLCIKLNGRKRLSVFWDSSDTFLKFIILLLPMIGVTVVLISHIYFGLGALVMSLGSMIFIMPVMLIIFSYFLQFSQYIFRKRGKTLPALSLAFFAVEALVNRNVVRSFDNKTGEFFYYSTVHKYNNEVNAASGFSSIHVQTSSSIYGNLNDQAIGEK